MRWTTWAKEQKVTSWCWVIPQEVSHEWYIKYRTFYLKQLQPTSMHHSSVLYYWKMHKTKIFDLIFDTPNKYCFNHCVCHCLTTSRKQLLTHRSCSKPDPETMLGRQWWSIGSNWSPLRSSINFPSKWSSNRLSSLNSAFSSEACISQCSWW